MLACKWPRKEYPKTHTQPSNETTQSFYPTLSGRGKKKSQRKGKSPKQVYSSVNKFYLEYCIVRSSQLSPKGQKLLQLCPVDKVEEKLLESCLCSEKQSVLTVRAVLQKCPGQGLRTRGNEGQEGNLGSGGQRQPPYWEPHSGHGTRVTGCLESHGCPHHLVPQPRRNACSW